MPKLSIITVCRNEEAGIAKTAESIVRQTWQDFEWIVIDGASTDGTLGKLKPYAGRIGRLVSEPDSGIYNAMNKGIRLAQGEYLIFMNGGDAFHHPEVLEEVFSKNPDGDVLYGDVILDNGGEQTKCEYPSSIKSPLWFANRCISHQGAFIRKELFNRYGMYDETLQIVSDWKHWIIFSLNGCSFRHIGGYVAVCDGMGITETRHDETRREQTSIINTYFHAGELDNLNRDAIIIWYKLFGLIPLVKLKKKRRKTRYLLFGIIPLLCGSR